jgi:hypothetical protein
MKAMVIEAANRNREGFYSADEKAQIKAGLGIPVGTLAWLGRISAKGFHAGGTDIWGEIDKVPKAFHGSVTTIIVGHLVIQLVSGHILLHAADSVVPNCKEGAWDVSLLDIWPAMKSLHWPPPVSFTLRGSDSIARLVSRFKIGTNVG